MVVGGGECPKGILLAKAFVARAGHDVASDESDRMDPIDDLLLCKLPEAIRHGASEDEEQSQTGNRAGIGRGGQASARGRRPRRVFVPHTKTHHSGMVVTTTTAGTGGRPPGPLGPGPRALLRPREDHAKRNLRLSPRSAG